MAAKTPPKKSQPEPLPPEATDQMPRISLRVTQEQLDFMEAHQRRHRYVEVSTAMRDVIWAGIDAIKQKEGLP